jgi:uncharacterized membrane protein
MSIEQFKMIIEVIQSAGDSGREILIWWVVMDHGLSFVIQLLLIILTFAAIVKAIRVFVNVQQHVQRFEQIRDIILPGRYHGDITDEEWVRIIKELQRFKSQNDQK